MPPKVLSQVKERTLVNGGTNAGFASSDCRLIEYTGWFVDVTGINNAKVENLPIGTLAAKVITTKGPVIGIMHQYVHHGKGQTIHSPHQMAHFGLVVDVYAIMSR